MGQVVFLVTWQASGNTSPVASLLREHGSIHGNIAQVSYLCQRSSPSFNQASSSENDVRNFVTHQVSELLLLLRGVKLIL